MKPTNEQIDWVVAYLQKHNLGMRGVFDGDCDRQFYGLLAEIMVKDLLKQPRPDMDFSAPNPFGDGGFDFIYNSKKVDVKCERRNVTFKPHFVHNLVGNQIWYKTDYYLFCSWNVPRYSLKICGIISKGDFAQLARFYKKGESRKRDDGTEFFLQADLYEIDDKCLTKNWRDVLR